MASQKPDEIHIRHCMLYEFHKGSKATVATRSICHVYPNALTIRTCQRWFSKFKGGNFNLFNLPRPGRPRVLDNDLLRAEVEANPCQTIEQLAQKLKQPWSTVQNHLREIGKVNIAGVWVSFEGGDSATLKSKTPHHKTNCRKTIDCMAHPT